jgi:hypothetical protein
LPTLPPNIQITPPSFVYLATADKYHRLTL